MEGTYNQAYSSFNINQLLPFLMVSEDSCEDCVEDVVGIILETTLRKY